MSKVLGLIPAKANSTRLKNKNMRVLGGKTLIERAICGANKSGVIDHLVLSTESKEIFDYAKGLDVHVPFIRPDYLSYDPSGVVDVALHALEELEKKGNIFEHLIILLPSSPFRTAEDIRNAYKKFVTHKMKFLMSVAEYPHTPYEAVTLDEKGIITPEFENYINLPANQLRKAYRSDGALHILDIKAFKKEKSYYAQPLYSYVMSRYNSVDIDNEEDLCWAEYLLEKKIKND